MALTPQQKTLRKEWVAALRSGKYRQASEVLHDGGNKYCCLGVLCALYKKAGGRFDDFVDAEELNGDGLDSVGIRVNDMTNLIKLNDTGISFHEIAACIENLPE